MKKTLYTATAAIIGLALAMKSGLFTAVFMFVLMGIIPGTNITIPANVMLLMMSTMMCAIFFFTIGRDILRYIFEHYTLHAKHAKAHLPKRRYGEI